MSTGRPIPRAGSSTSQSYIAGILCIPILVRAVDGELLSSRKPGFRAMYWTLCLGTFGFILWWKGGLMIAHGKAREAVGWVALTGVVWVVLRAAEALPAAVADVSRGQLLRRLLFAVACFFLIMSVVDPVLQIGVQGAGWSKVLIIEMSFFIPAGFTLLFVSHRLKPETGSS